MFSWRTGQQCRKWAIRGLDRCRKHGGGGLNQVQGWKRYLLWVMLPETVRFTGEATPVTDEMVSIACMALADAMLTGDARLSAQARMKAVEFLFDSQAIDTHPDPASLLTHLSREDALTAVRILRLNGLMH